MNIGVRGKLFIVSVLLIFTADLATGFFLENVLRNWIEASIQDDLLRNARGAREMVLQGAVPETIESMDLLADRFGKAIENRVTIIAVDGQVLGDSQLEVERVRTIENHGNRPEVRQAMQESVGISRRFSTTLRAEMLYVAIPYQHDEGAGVVRVQVSLKKVDETINRLRLFLLVAGGLGLGIAILISWLASHLLTRTLRTLVENAQQMAAGVSGQLAAGALGQRLEVKTRDEFSGLAGSFNRLARELEAAVNNLAGERHRFEAVLEGMSEAVIALDREGRIILVNRAAHTLLSWKQAPIGQSLAQLPPITEVAELIQNSQPCQSASAQFNLPGSVERRVLARVTGQKGEGGSVVVLHDITEIHRLEEMRREFVANVSHELRTPTAIILANSELLLDGAMSDPKVGPSMLNAMKRHAQRLSALITRLLDLSRIDSGHYPLEIRAVDLVEKTAHCIDSMGRSLEEKEIRISVDTPPHAQVMADGGALIQIILNLLENGVKYTPPQGQIQIRCQASGGEVTLEVEDDGPGIAAHHRERLFERFYRADPGRSREMGGTGLGLAIVKSLVEAMNGTVGMRPADPQGSIFWVVLPEAQEPSPGEAEREA
ncbi:MAG: HAMP domain-containing protein [Magnetococcales bacterium]|nr:HAMP domain-containing protein [Magnetococcales bacterium]